MDLAKLGLTGTNRSGHLEQTGAEKGRCQGGKQGDEETEKKKQNKVKTNLIHH